MSQADNREIDARMGRAWREHRRYVLGIGLRMLGDLAEAEDVVQEAFARLLRTDIDEIDDVRGWLVTVVSRLCLDQLRSARRQRQQPLDTPGRRAPAACRQLASRARRHIADDGHPARFAIETAEEHHVTERFIRACTTGDIEALLAVLDPDVSGQADLGGTIGLRPPVTGRRRVAAGTLPYLGPDSGTTLVPLPTGRNPSVAAIRDDQVVAVVTLVICDGLVHHIDALADPVKLAAVTSALQG